MIFLKLKLVNCVIQTPMSGLNFKRLSSQVSMSKTKKQLQHSYFGNMKAGPSWLGVDSHRLFYIVLAFVFHACIEPSWVEISRILQMFHESLDHPTYTESGWRTWDPGKWHSLFCVREESKNEKKKAIPLFWFTFNNLVSYTILATTKKIRRKSLKLSLSFRRDIKCKFF